MAARGERAFVRAFRGLPLTERAVLKCIILGMYTGYLPQDVGETLERARLDSHLLEEVIEAFESEMAFQRNSNGERVQFQRWRGSKTSAERIQCSLGLRQEG